MSARSRLGLYLHPVDRAIGALLVVSIVVGVASWRTGVPEVAILTRLHLALLVALVLFCVAASRRGHAPWVVFGRPLLAIVIIYTLYTSLGRLGLASMPFRADETLSALDTWLFAGRDPSLLLEPWLSPGRVEFYAFFYALFIPYINLSLILGSLGRPPVERDQFLTGWAFTYALSYLGYLFLPAQGPVVLHAADYGVALQGGYFLHTILRAVENTGGNLGAFPSLHVGASVYLCLFDVRTSRLRGLTYLPIVLLICVATVVLRFHYVVDLVAGAAIGYACTRLGPWAMARWAKARQGEGLPALPGGEGDVLPAVS
jgi:membrane-associated phospholipid phosphatase